MLASATMGLVLILLTEMVSKCFCRKRTGQKREPQHNPHCPGRICPFPFETPGPYHQRPGPTASPHHSPYPISIHTGRVAEVTHS